MEYQDWPPLEWVSSHKCSPEVAKRNAIPELLDAIAEMQPGDELQKFNSDSESWDNLGGRKGYVVLRGGKIVCSIVTEMN